MKLVLQGLEICTGNYKLKVAWSFTLLHSEQPKPYGVLAILSAIGLKYTRLLQDLKS